MYISLNIYKIIINRILFLNPMRIVWSKLQNRAPHENRMLNRDLKILRWRSLLSFLFVFLCQLQQLQSVDHSTTIYKRIILLKRLNVFSPKSRYRRITENSQRSSSRIALRLLFERTILTFRDEGDDKE